MSPSSVVLICLAAAALLLFLYTFKGHIDVQFLRPNSSLPFLSSSSRPPVVRSTNSSSPSTAFFEKQAVQRKSMFAAVLNQSNPREPTLMQFFAPEVYCPSLVRVGSVADGGKWVCNPWAMPKGGVVFSLGSRDDVSFESDFQQATAKAATIITVDRNAVSQTSLNELAKLNGKFVHATLAPKTDLAASPPQYTVADLMKKMGHDDIELLKMDIEGAEVAVLPQFLNGNAVCQIMVEIHPLNEVARLLRTVANAGFLLQKHEINPDPGALPTGISEYSFIHESCLEKYGATLLSSYLKE